MFPFSNLNPNAGTRLRSEISLPPPTLFYPNHGGIIVDQLSDISVRSNGSHDLERMHDLADTGGERQEIDAGINAPPTQPQQFPSDQVGVDPREDSSSVPGSFAPQLPRDGGVALDPTRHECAQLAGEDSGRAAASPQHVPGPRAQPTGLPPTHVRDESAPHDRCSAEQPEVVAGSTSEGDLNAESTTAAPERPTTRLQKGIHKEKVYTDGTIRYHQV